MLSAILRWVQLVTPAVNSLGADDSLNVQVGEVWEERGILRCCSQQVLLPQDQSGVL